MRQNRILRSIAGAFSSELVSWSNHVGVFNEANFRKLSCHNGDLGLTIHRFSQLNNTQTYAIPYIMQKLEWLFWVFTIWYQLVLPVKDNIVCKVIKDNLRCWLTIDGDQLSLQERGTYFLAIVIQMFSMAVVLMNQRGHKCGWRWEEGKGIWLWIIIWKHLIAGYALLR